MSDVLIWLAPGKDEKKHPGNPRKLEWVTYKGGKCMKCGYDRCIQSLTFHHMNPELKRFYISTGTNNIQKDKDARRGKTKLDIFEELDKCILLCHNCHYELEAGLWKISHVKQRLKPKQMMLEMA